MGPGNYGRRSKIRLHEGNEWRIRLKRTQAGHKLTKTQIILPNTSTMRVEKVKSQIILNYFSACYESSYRKVKQLLLQ